MTSKHDITIVSHCIRGGYATDTPRLRDTRSYSATTRYLRNTFVYNPVKEMSTMNDILKL